MIEPPIYTTRRSAAFDDQTVLLYGYEIVAFFFGDAHAEEAELAAEALNDTLECRVACTADAGEDL